MRFPPLFKRTGRARSACLIVASAALVLGSAACSGDPRTAHARRLANAHAPVAGDLSAPPETTGLSAFSSARGAADDY